MPEKEVLEKFSTHIYDIDTDKDERISLDEMREWLTRDAIIDARLFDDETSSDFVDMDTNNDMKIDVEEMIQYHKRRFGKKEKLYRK